MTDHPELKAVATVRDVARMVGLSPARFYQLQRHGIFPLPVYSITTRRPLYTEEQQRLCLEVRRRNCGINGTPVLFYARGTATPARKLSPRKPHVGAVEGGGRHQATVEYLRGMGLAHVTAEQIDAALRAEYPQGTQNVDNGTVLGRLFVRLHRQNSGDKHRR